MSDGRRFNGSERVQLYLSSGGLCASCGGRLKKGWHADHVTPWSAGGKTVTENGQALCPTCNLKKGVRVGMQPWSRPLRAWQQRALDDYWGKGAKDFLLVATPGGGKTKAMLRIGHDLLSTGKVLRLAFVVPTLALKKQVADAAHECGIRLDPTFLNRFAAEADDVHGVVLTYAQVAANPELHRRHCLASHTAVFLDEVHHLGVNCSWGEAAVRAFGTAAFRVSGSGTLWRDGAIPFVTYDPDGQCVPDSTYTYASAVEDGVCRAIEFPLFSCDSAWVLGGSKQKARLGSAASEEEESLALRAALQLDGEFPGALLRAAHAQLAQLRQADPAAGGLATCMDQDHARGVADILKKVTGRAPLVAVSDDANARNAIEAFRKGADEWLVAVKMVSEGVDIQRLRVNVYLTSTLTELFFRQSTGRIIRVRDDLRQMRVNQTAYGFIPNHPTLREFALRMREEIRHLCQAEPPGDPAPRDPRDPRDPPRQTFFALGSESAGLDGVVADEEEIAPDEIEDGRHLIEQLGNPELLHHVRNKDLAALARNWRASGGRVERPHGKAADDGPPDYERKDVLSHAVNGIVRFLGKKLEGRQGDGWDSSYQFVGVFTKVEAGIPWRDNASKPTLVQLERRLVSARGLRERYAQAATAGPGAVTALVQQMRAVIQSAS